MTPKQRELLDFIEQYIGHHRYAPTYEEMRLAMGISTKSGVARLLNALEEQGQIVRRASRARAIEIKPLAKFSIPDLRKELARRGAL